MSDLEYSEQLEIENNIKANQSLYDLLSEQGGAPVYIADGYELISQLGVKNSFELEIIFKALTKANYSRFDFPITGAGTPAIMLIKNFDFKARKVCDILQNAGITVLHQDANKPFRPIVCTELSAIKQELAKQYQENFSASSAIPDFKNVVNSNANTPAIKTGFPILDDVLDGGLYEGLYAIGAISSLGKTTFCLNIAEQIAKSGHDVIIIALEMSKYSLIGRSISRLTFLKHQNSPDSVPYELCKTSRGITDGSRYKNYSDAEKKNIEDALKFYASNIGPHLYIHEAVGDMTAEKIKDIVTNHISFTGTRPVLIIDYLQLIQHKDKFINGNDKIRTDFNLTELKRLSRDFKLPIIAISSFNRASYNTEVKMECFKESGGIDYTCDVIMGLQLSGVGGADFDVNEAKAKNPREIELVFLKNREAAVGDLIKYYYFPMFNHFQESEEDVRGQREYEREQAKAAKEKAKQEKRALDLHDRAELVDAAYNACVENGSALISEMVDFCGGTPKEKTMTKYIKETGRYTIYGNKVIRNSL